MERSWNNLDRITPEIHIQLTDQELINTLKQKKCFFLLNGEKININEISVWFNDACDRLSKKYWFNPLESNILKSNTKMNPCNTELWLRWLSSNYIQKCDDWQRKPICKIDLNPNMIHNKQFYIAVLLHELDHHAFVVKKFLNSKLYQCNHSSKYNEQKARQEFNIQMNSPSWSFSTELMARIDTADELMKAWISWDKVWNYWPWNEYETTWEAIYTESILYAKKFLSIQIWLYNLLAKHYWLDGHKQKNQQLPDKANNQFQIVMNRLRDEIFNSPSIEHSKYVIEDSYEKLQGSRWSRNKFCSLREQ